MNVLKIAALLALLVAGGVGVARASAPEHAGPPGGPPPTHAGPPSLIGDSYPYPIKYTKYSTLVSGSKSASRSSAKPSRVITKEPVKQAPPDEVECVVISTADMQQALQGCMNQGNK